MFFDDITFNGQTLSFIRENSNAILSFILTKVFQKVSLKQLHIQLSFKYPFIVHATHNQTDYTQLTQ